MELYQAYTDYEGMMELTESMFRYLAERFVVLRRFPTMVSRSTSANLFERLTMNDAIKKICRN